MTDSALEPKTAVVAAQNLARDDDTEGMSYLETPLNRLVTLYIPLFIIVVILLFPFYWMALTSIKPDEQLIDMNTYNPFWVVHPTLKHIEKLLFETQYPRWLWNTMYVATAATFLSVGASDIYRGYRICAFPDALDAKTPDIGYMPGHLTWKFGEKLKALGFDIINNDISGAVHQDRKLLTGDSPLAGNNLGKLAAGALLKEVAAG